MVDMPGRYITIVLGKRQSLFTKSVCKYIFRFAFFTELSSGVLDIVLTLCLPHGTIMGSLCALRNRYCVTGQCEVSTVCVAVVHRIAGTNVYRGR